MLMLAVKGRDARYYGRRMWEKERGRESEATKAALPVAQMGLDIGDAWASWGVQGSYSADEPYGAWRDELDLRSCFYVWVIAVSQHVLTTVKYVHQR